MIYHDGRGCIFPDKIALMYDSHQTPEDHAELYENGHVTGGIVDNGDSGLKTQ